MTLLLQQNLPKPNGSICSVQTGVQLTHVQITQTFSRRDSKVCLSYAGFRFTQCSIQTSFTVVNDFIRCSFVLNLYVPIICELRYSELCYRPERQFRTLLFVGDTFKEALFLLYHIQHLSSTKIANCDFLWKNLNLAGLKNGGMYELHTFSFIENLSFLFYFIIICCVKIK